MLGHERMQGWETHADVEEVVRLLAAGLDEILGEQLLGLYLTGSLSAEAPPSRWVWSRR